MVKRSRRDDLQYFHLQMKYGQYTSLVAAIMLTHISPVFAEAGRHEQCLSATDYKGCMGLEQQTNSDKVNSFGYFSVPIWHQPTQEMKLHVSKVVRNSPAERAGINGGR